MIDRRAGQIVLGRVSKLRRRIQIDLKGSYVSGRFFPRCGRVSEAVDRGAAQRRPARDQGFVLIRPKVAGDPFHTFGRINLIVLRFRHHAHQHDRYNSEHSEHNLVSFGNKIIPGQPHHHQRKQKNSAENPQVFYQRKERVGPGPSAEQVKEI